MSISKHRVVNVGKRLERRPCYTRAEMNVHVANSGKHIVNTEHHAFKSRPYRSAAIYERGNFAMSLIALRNATLELKITIVQRNTYRKGQRT